MSTRNTGKITCVKCRYVYNIEVWSSINVTIDPDLEKRFINGSLNTFNCPKCGTVNRSGYDTLYHDMDRDFMVKYSHNIDESEDEVLRTMGGIQMMEDYKYLRRVSSWNQLKEKVAIFREDLDDLAIELVKADILVNSLGYDAPIDNVLWFIRVEAGEREKMIVFQKYENDSYDGDMHCPYGLYSHFMTNVVAKASDFGKGRFTLVNQATLPSILTEITKSEPIPASVEETQSTRLYDGKSRYSIVWRECGVDSELAERFHVPSFEGFLPFFIWGKDLDRFEAKRSVELREEQLLKGILYGMHEAEVNPHLWHRNEDRETHLYLLDVLGNGFRYSSPEKMILDVAYDVRETNGSKPSYAILKSGLSLMPSSSKIRSDLILDIWEMLSDDKIDRSLLEETFTLVQEIELSELNPDAKEVVCYYGFCALLLINRYEEIEKYLEEYIYPNVENRQLKNRIKSYLESGLSTPSECLISGL